MQTELTEEQRAFLSRFMQNPKNWFSELVAAQGVEHATTRLQVRLDGYRAHLERMGNVGQPTPPGE